MMALTAILSVVGAILVILFVPNAHMMYSGENTIVTPEVAEMQSRMWHEYRFTIIACFTPALLSFIRTAWIFFNSEEEKKTSRLEEWIKKQKRIKKF